MIVVRLPPPSRETFLGGRSLFKTLILGDFRVKTVHDHWRWA